MWFFNSDQSEPSEGSASYHKQGRQQWKEWTGAVPQSVRAFVITWLFLKYIIFFYLCTRQHKVLSERRNPPRAFKGKISSETLERARQYHLEMNYLNMFCCLYWMVYQYVSLFVFGFTGFWFMSGPILDTLGFWPHEWDQETGESIVFMCLLVLRSYIAHLPIDWYKTFVIEEKYGFNNMSYGEFLSDWAKKLLMEAVFWVFTGVGILWLVRTTGKWFFLWLWISSFLWLIITRAVYPTYISPAFVDTYTPLREGRLKTRLKKLANFFGFPLEEILVLHQSWRSEHRKAYFYGFGDHKRIVIYDTYLIGYPEADEDIHEQEPVKRRSRITQNDESNVTESESVPSRILQRAHQSQLDNEIRNRIVAGSKSDDDDDDSVISRETASSISQLGFREHEIEAMVARLIGHWKLGHSFNELVLPFISMFLWCVIFYFVYEKSSLFQAFDVPWEMDTPILLGLKLLYTDMMDIYRFFVESIMSHLKRNRIYEADAFATKLGYGEDLIAAYIKSGKANLDYPYFDEWYWNFIFDKPSVLYSIQAIETEMERLK